MRFYVSMSVFIVFIVCVVAGVSADTSKIFNIGNASEGSSIFQLNNVPSLKSMSLLDPERFTMRQETMVSYSSSSRMGSNMNGLYLNTMEYRFQMPLTMRLRVAYENDMGSLLGNKSITGAGSKIETGRVYIPSFDIVYQPWENTFISFHYRDYSGTANYMYSPYSRYNRYSPYGFFR